jgi:hypothetical protein
VESDAPDKLTPTRSILREAHGGLGLDLLGFLTVGIGEIGRVRVEDWRQPDQIAGMLLRQ